MKVPIEFEDFDPQDPDIEFRKNRWDYWNILRKIRAEAFADQPDIGQFDFSEYVEKNYGIKINMADGHITDKFDIVDEKLYTYFMLKWM
jgi:hypothetical protein